LGVEVELRKALLRAASVLALTAATQSPANAAISPEDNNGSLKAPVSTQAKSDPLLELLSRTNGSLATAAVESALATMFSDPSAEQVKSFPGFLFGLADLGAPQDVLAATRVVLEKIIASSSLDDDLRQSLLSQLEAGTGPFKLAQRAKKKRDPDEVGQVPPASQS
jgi:hypothetical protein